MDVDLDGPSEACLTAPVPSLVPATTSTAPPDDAPLVLVDEATIKHEVLSVLLASSEPAPPPEAWQFIGRSDDIRHLTLGRFVTGPHELGVVLRRRFTEQQFAAAGKIVGEPLLNRLKRLFGGHREFVAIRDDAQRIRNICTESGLLWPDEPPALSRALLRADGSATSDQVPQLLAETVDDVQVLRGLGFEAELSFGMQWLSAASVGKLFAPDSPDERWLHHLIIADWNVSRLDCSERPRTLAILKRLALMHETYGHDPGCRFTRWRPNQKARTAIRNAHRFRDVHRLRDLIRASVPAPQIGRTWCYHIQPVQVTYHGARLKLQNVLRRSTEIPLVAEVKQALEEFRAVSQSKVTAQLYALADRAESPMVRAMIHEATELHERWFETQAVVEAAKKVLAGNHPGSDWELNADDLKERTILNGKLFAMFNKLSAMN